MTSMEHQAQQALEAAKQSGEGSIGNEVAE